MNRAIHGAPAQALSDALSALARLSRWVSLTADPDLPPDGLAGVRAMREAAAGIRVAADLLDRAADRAEADGRDEPSRDGSAPPPLSR